MDVYVGIPYPLWAADWTPCLHAMQSTAGNVELALDALAQISYPHA